MKIKYQDIALRTKAVATIEKANEIIEEYAKQGFNLTLRQLYYQFVSRDLIKNEQKEYDKLGVVISNGRRAGLIDWDAIVDRTRFLRKTPHWDSPQSIVQSCAEQFRFNLWQDQPCYVEVWFEKDALLGVFERAAEEMRVPFFSCRGYVSDSEAWATAQRLERFAGSGIHAFREVYILHFGDHDPSGLDMTRDIKERLELFGASPKVKRLALNMDQVRKYNPPPNPAKENDSRFTDYVRKYGDKSWELDALNPDILNKLVRDELAELMDMKLWNKALGREKKAREQLNGIATNYHEIVKSL
jgi:hypothetical protein